MAAGSYLVTINGWATVAPNPPVVLRLVGLGTETVDEDGGFSGSIMSSVAGNFRNNRQILLMFTKTNRYPMTAIVEMKQAAN